MSQRGGRLNAVVNDVCAMANTNGGTIYLGVGPDTRQPILGVTDSERAVKELRTTIARMLTPQLGVTVDLHETQGKKIIRVLVPHGDDPPYAVEDNKIFVREEAETSLAVRDEIVQLVLRGQSGEGAAPLGAAAAAAAAPVEAAAIPAAATPAGGQSSAPAAVQTATPMAAEAPAGSIGSPRTGVEIVGTEDRDGSRYHTMRDLRNGSVVKNVTRSSARKLWHYAISAKESGALNPEHVSWQGNVGLWRKTHKGGATRYDLVQRGEGGMRVYYGVTEDGIHGAWRRLLEAEERRTGQLAPAGVPANGQPLAADVYAGELAPGPGFSAVEASSPPPVEVEALPTPALLLTAGEPMEADDGRQDNAAELVVAEAEPAPRRRRSAKNASAKTAGNRSSRKPRPTGSTKTAAKTSSRKRAKPAAGPAA
jgi:hypothetical protein